MKIEINENQLAAAIQEWFDNTDLEQRNVFTTNIVAKTLKDNLRKNDRWKNKGRENAIVNVAPEELLIIKQVKKLTKLILRPGFLNVKYADEVIYLNDEEVSFSCYGKSNDNNIEIVRKLVIAARKVKGLKPEAPF